MTGSVSTPDPAADLRTRIADAFAKLDARDWGYDHGFVAYGSDAESDAFVDAAVEAMREHVTDVHTRNANLRSDHRREIRRLNAEHRELGFERDRLRHALQQWEATYGETALKDASAILVERERLRSDALKARKQLMELVGGDWTVQPSLDTLASCALRFFKDAQSNVKRLESENARLVSGSTPTIPDDAEFQLRSYIGGWFHGRDEEKTGPEMVYALAMSLVEDLLEGWGSAVANPTDRAAISTMGHPADQAVELVAMAFFDDMRLWFTFTGDHAYLGGPSRARQAAAARAVRALIDARWLTAPPAPAAGDADTRTPDEAAADTEDDLHHATWNGKTPPPDGSAGELGPPYRVGGYLGGWDRLPLDRTPGHVLHPMDPADVVEPAPSVAPDVTQPEED